MLRFLPIFLYVFTLFFITKLSAETLTKIKNDAQSLSIPYYQQSITLDGQLDEAIWQKARQFPLNYTIEPFENTKATVQTDVYIYESGDNLYVGFRAQDPHPRTYKSLFT